MSPLRRRDFISRASAIGLASVAGNAWAGGIGALAAPGPSDARVLIDPSHPLAPLDRNIFGSFLEHLGRAIYEGIYDPGSPEADAMGFRKDVLAEIRGLGVPIIRYPGGNFVSGYNWLDGVGPRAGRPTVLDRAWDTIETNQFGTDDYMEWCVKAQATPLMAVNLGAGSAKQAGDLVEYCNLEKGTKWSDLRRKNGHESPYQVKHWCLGNEMDGPWQIGHSTATEYGLKAADAARQMRAIDPSLFLVVCGSSGPMMPTYLEWDREVLEQCYPVVDAISLHRYFNNTAETGGDSRHYLALNLTMDQQIEEAAAVCDVVRGRLRTDKRLHLSFDEWNVWYRARDGDGHKQVAPHLLEEVYNLEDALLVGGCLNTLLRHADRVRIACLAQLVNVIAPLMTNRTSVLRQTIYYPYAWALHHCRGEVLDVRVESPTYEVSRFGRVEQVPYLDVVATRDPANGETTLLVLNRDLDNSRQVELNWRAAAPKRVKLSQTITGSDLKASNTFSEPNKVVPQNPQAPGALGPRMSLEAPAKSYSVFVFETA
ncbi:MAG: alpha-N-arabinofuranosidase [Terriglobia bacterium]